MIYNGCLSAHTQKSVNQKTETFVTIGDMTYVREITETDFYNYVFIFSNLIQSAYFLSLFELVNLLSRQFYAFNAYILLLHVFPLSYSNAGGGYTF